MLSTAAWYVVKVTLKLNTDADHGGVELRLAGGGADGHGAMLPALPLPASRWRQEPKKTALGFCPVDWEPQVSSDS